MVLQGETSPARDRDKRTREPTEKEEVGSRWGENRSKTSPENEASCKRMTIVSRLRANLTPSSRKSETRTGKMQLSLPELEFDLKQAKSRDLCIFPQPAPHLTSDQQLPPSVWQGFLYCFILRSCCSTGRQRAATET